jgi:hypothetical protein
MVANNLRWVVRVAKPGRAYLKWIINSPEATMVAKRLCNNLKLDFEAYGGKLVI